MWFGDWGDTPSSIYMQYFHKSKDSHFIHAIFSYNTHDKQTFHFNFVIKMWFMTSNSWALSTVWLKETKRDTWNKKLSQQLLYLVSLLIFFSFIFYIFYYHYHLYFIYLSTLFLSYMYLLLLLSSFCLFFHLLLLLSLLFFMYLFIYSFISLLLLFFFLGGGGAGRG